MKKLAEYIKKRKKRDPEFAVGYEAGYQAFKRGITLRQARGKTGLSQKKIRHKN